MTLIFAARCFLLGSYLSSMCSATGCRFTNHFAVMMSTDDASTVARQLGFRCRTRVFEDERIYDLVHGSVPSCSSHPSHEHVTQLLNSPQVLWAEQQEIREHVVSRKSPHSSTSTRLSSSSSFKGPILFDDPLYRDQWYLHNEGQTGAPVGNDLLLVGAWTAGFTGRDVVVSVLDDGLLHTHPDIRDNYEASVSYDLVEYDVRPKDPTPDANPDNNHGTYCAGVVAAVANNSICGVGVAYNAKVGGVRVLDGRVTDVQEALALTLGLSRVDVYSASWGPKDDGRHLDGPHTLATRALIKGIHKGRGGLGAVYVWAVGNGGAYGDNGNMDGYVGSIYTLAMGALTDSGLSAYYSEPSSATLASAFVGGSHQEDLQLSEDSDRSRSNQVVVPELNGGCGESFGGTSAAAPMAAGIVALMLEANGNLTWRDVQHVVVESARLPNVDVGGGWRVNAAGYHWHPRCGFGALAATRAVATAQRWANVGPLRRRTLHPRRRSRKLLPGFTVSVLIDNDNAPWKKQRVAFVEYALLRLRVEGPVPRGCLEVVLTSPSGTNSPLLTVRPQDANVRGLRDWQFTSVHFWGEKPTGTWMATVTDTRKQRTDHSMSYSVVTVKNLQLLGTSRPWKGIVDAEPFRPTAAYLKLVAAKELLDAHVLPKEENTARRTSWNAS